MTEINAETFRKLYMDAAKVDGKPGIYFIGPFGRRVSFASQQRRALNTVWALERTKKIKEGDDVAVIGGGLAGLMAAAALLARKCTVWIYEARPRVLNIQEGTLHRYVHPSVNFWPEKALDPTTTFPFFDWFADICGPVIGGIGEEWVSFFEDKVTDIFTSTTVERVELIESGELTRNNVVRIHAAGLGPKEMVFDAVLFATGFGDEIKLSGAASSTYWQEDFLAETCGSTGGVVVSGTGDGGLIDALRCVHKDFKRGKIGVNLAHQLDITSIKQKLIDIEGAVLEKGGADEHQASKLYNTAYSSLIAKLPKHIRESLGNSLLNRLPPVRLVGRLPHPYTRWAAPIHKLIIAHAIEAGAVSYVQGEVVDGPILRVVGRPDEDLAGSTCVARHGSEPPLKGILTDPEIEQLRNSQRMLADLLDEMPYDDSHWFNWADYPARNTESIEFARFRLPLAASHVMRAHNLRLALGSNNGRARYVIGVDPGGGTPLGGLPSSIFGIQAVSQPAPLVDAYAE